MRIFKLLIFIVLPVLFSCKNEKKLSDAQLIEKNVRDFFFMGDSVNLDISITDTIRVDELNKMISSTEENKKLIQLDIDTLNLMIEDWAYKTLEFEQTNQTINAYNSKIKTLEYRVKLRDLEFKRLEFGQTLRVMLHLKRSVWADIAGFEITVKYIDGKETGTIELLMDANYNIVD